MNEHEKTDSAGLIGQTIPECEETEPRLTIQCSERVVHSALNALLAWNAARQEVNRLKGERNSHRCSEACAADFETGDSGQGPCWQLGDTESMCDECKERQKFTEPIQWAVRKASELRQKMQRQATRLQKVGSHGTPVSTQSSGSAQSEAKEDISAITEEGRQQEQEK